MNQNCSTCRAWKKIQQGGECRRYPPISAGHFMVKAATVANPQGSPQPIPIFCLPQTTEDHWCGEWSPAMVS